MWILIVTLYIGTSPIQKKFFYPTEQMCNEKADKILATPAAQGITVVDANCVYFGHIQ